MTKTQKTVLLAIGLALLGAFLYRVRGGFLPTGSTQLARLIWSLPTGLMAALVVPRISLWQRAVIACGTTVGAFAGALVPHDPFQWLGDPTIAPVAWWWAEGAGVGILIIGLILLTPIWAVRAYNRMAFAVVGILTPLLWYLGRFLPATALWGFIDWHTAWGEAFFGGLIWGLVFLVLRKV